MYIKGMGNNTVNILGVPYAVRRVPYVSRNEYRVAEIDFEAQEIRLLDSLKAETAGTAFFHELVHGILCGLRYNDENDNEKLVQGLAVGLYQALSDPQFHNFYKQEVFMNKKQTSKPVATKASKLLTDGRTGKTTKSVAGSALSQTRTTGKSKSKK
jgi:hypothetical protein